MKTKNIDVIILAMCALHNFIRIYDGDFSTPKQPNIIQQIQVPNMQLLNNTTQNLRYRLCRYFCEISESKILQFVIVLY